MRLDRWLWWTRLAKTRSAAQALATHGTLRIDGRACDKAHLSVRAGQTLVFFAHDRVRVVRVVGLPSRRGPAPEAQACYLDLSPANVSQQAPTD